MREEGSGFFSFSISATQDSAAPTSGTGNTQTIYAEYGFRPRLTFGANAWRTETEAAAYVFLRHPLSGRDAARKLAVELSLGTFTASGAEHQLTQRLGFSVGQGFVTRWGPGWMQLDTSYEYRSSPGTEIFKAEATVGVSYSSNRKAMLQIFAEQTNDDPLLLTLSPSYLHRIAPNTHVVLGADYEVSGGNQIGLRVGTWLEF